MREIKHEILSAKSRISLLKGRTVKLRHDKGRGKITEYVGTIESAYPYVFTFRHDDKIITFSYTDLLTKSIKIYKN